MAERRDATLLSIGDFSRFSGLSVRMLRHYDEHGVLHPARVDEFTAYRRYAPAQLRDAARIRALRDAGCGVAQIAELLPLFADRDALTARLAQHLRALDEESDQVAARRAHATGLLARLADESDRSGGIEVGERMLPPLRVLSLRRTVADYPAEGELWAELRRLLGAPAGVDAARFGPVIGATYFDDDYRDERVEIAIWREYDGEYTPRRSASDHNPDDGFHVVQLSEQRVAWAVHRGSFDDLARTTEAIGAWIAEHGRTRAGPMSNIYVVGPGREANPDNWVTEVNFPVE